MGTQQRRDRERGELKSLIMDTARQLFAAEGYEAVSMRRIAESIEYSATAIYVHFKDKDALIREICRADFHKLAELSNKLRKIADPIERIRELGHAYVRFAVQHPNHYRLMFMTPDDKGELSAEDLQYKGNPDADAYAFLLQCVQEALATGRFRPEYKNAELITQTFWVAPHGVASLEIAKASDGWVKLRPLGERTSAAIDSMIRGMTVQKKKKRGAK